MGGGGSITAAGSALAWVDLVLRVETGQPYVNSAHFRDRLVFIPHLQGERCPAWEPSTRGSWLELTAGHTSGDLRRAAWVGVVVSL